jgi:fatty-acid desaturase
MQRSSSKQNCSQQVQHQQAAAAANVPLGTMASRTMWRVSPRTQTIMKLLSTVGATQVTLFVLQSPFTFCRTFTWKNAFLGWLIYAIPGIFGITLCFHRMLTHR